MKSNNRTELIERCNKFWNCERTDRPLIGVLFNRLIPLSSFTNSCTGTWVQPNDITVEMFIADCERRYEASQQIGGDAIFVAYPYIGFPWLEAIMGSTVRIANGAGWSEPLKSDWRKYNIDSIPWNNGWFDKMQYQTNAAIKASLGRYPVGPCHLRGVGDLVPALIGQNEFCYALYDYPDILQRFIQVCIEVWTKVVWSQYELLPTESGGYWNGNQPLWTPGKTMFIPADIVSAISPETFKKFFLESMKNMLKGLDYCIMHTHSTYLHAYPLNLLLPIKQLRAIQVGLDTNGPTVKELLPEFRKILKQKSLIVSGTITVADIFTLVSELPSKGLCILSYLETVEEGKILLSNLRNVAHLCIR